MSLQVSLDELVGRKPLSNESRIRNHSLNSLWQQADTLPDQEQQALTFLVIDSFVKKAMVEKAVGRPANVTKRAAAHAHRSAQRTHQYEFKHQPTILLVLLLPLELVTHQVRPLRGQRVIVDADLAALYGVETKRFNEAVKRNAEKFPADFMFQLTAEEFAALRSQIGLGRPGTPGPGRRWQALRATGVYRAWR